LVRCLGGASAIGGYEAEAFAGFVAFVCTNGREKYGRKPGADQPPVSLRRTLEAILWILKTGAPWRSIAEDLYPSCQSVVTATFMDQGEVVQKANAQYKAASAVRKR